MIGTKAANALSDFLKVVSKRDGKLATMEFEKGKRKSFNIKDDKDQIGTGTYIHFLPDKTIFTEEGIELPKVRIIKQLQEFSFLCSNLEITLNYKDDKPLVFKSANGLVDYVDSLVSKDKRITKTFHLNTQDGNYIVNLALGYSSEYNEILKLYTNNIPNKSGTHLTGFRSALTRTVNDMARTNNLLKEKEDNLTGEDLREGLILVLSLTMSDPAFGGGQTKEVLTSAEGRTVVERAVNMGLRNWFQSNPRELKVIVEKALLSRKARLAAKRAREATRGKSKTILSSNLQGKLADCITKDPDEAEIYLVEGE